MRSSLPAEKGKTLLFRIDRRFVNVSGVKFNKLDADEVPDEVGAEGEVPDAATSVKAVPSAEDAVNEYLSAARSETESKIEEILENARKEAEQIVLNARDDAEEERKRAMQEGFDEGFKEGSEKGKSSYDEQLADKIREDDEALKRVLDEIYEERERTYNELESETTNLALEIVRKIINPAEEELNTVFSSLIKNALRQMSTDGKIVIRVGATEYERFFSSGAATIELDSGVTVTASVIRDVSLEDGDCIIDTEDVTVNAGIESQLQYVELAFERANQYEPE